MYRVDYRSQQRTDLRDVGASPYFSDGELDRFHRQALRQYSRRRPQKKPFTLALTAGQDTCDLPGDWLAPDRPSFDRAFGIPDGADGGLFTFLDGNPPRLVMRPAPIADDSLPMFYLAAWALPAEDQDAPAIAGTVPDADADVVLALACHLACEALLGDTCFLADYKVGDEQVNRREVVAQLSAKSARKLAEFRRAVERPTGGMA